MGASSVCVFVRKRVCVCVFVPVILSLITDFNQCCFLVIS